MANDAYMIGANLLKAGTLVSFRIVEEEVLAAHDESEFGMRLLLKFVPEEGEDDQDEDDVAEDTNVADFIEGLRFVRGELHFDADYIRGRRIKTRVAVRANGTVRLETIGRGKAALRWLERMQGKKLLQLVGGEGSGPR
jgi:hypothetical protein